MKKLLFIAAMVWAVCMTNETVRGDIAQGVKVIVIDAGHGGSDPGAVAGGYREKDITLKVALRVGNLLENRLPGVKVVYTRKSDKSLTLKDRIAAAHGAKGDLYVSIHVNSAKAKSARGAETCIFSLNEDLHDVGRGSSERAESYNETVLTSHHYDELVKNKQVDMAYINRLRFVYGEHSEALAWHIQQNYAKSGRVCRGIKRGMFQVLYGVDMPSVITEIGFLSNAEDQQYMTSEKGQAQICEDICNAITRYVGNVNKGMQQEKTDEPEAKKTTVKEESAPAVQPAAETEPAAAATAGETKPAASEKTEQTPAAQPETAGAGQPRHGFTVQIMASKTPLSLNDACFKSRRGKVACYSSTGDYKYKYCVGFYESREAAQKAVPELKKEFGGAFVVEVDDDRIAK